MFALLHCLLRVYCVLPCRVHSAVLSTKRPIRRYIQLHFLSLQVQNKLRHTGGKFTRPVRYGVKVRLGARCNWRRVGCARCDHTSGGRVSVEKALPLSSLLPVSLSLLETIFDRSDVTSLPFVFEQRTSTLLLLQCKRKFGKVSLALCGEDACRAVPVRFLEPVFTR